MHERLRALFEASDLSMARALVHQLVDAYADRAPKAIQTLEAGFDDACAVRALFARSRATAPQRPPARRMIE